MSVHEKMPPITDPIGHEISAERGESGRARAIEEHIRDEIRRGTLNLNKLEEQLDWEDNQP